MIITAQLTSIAITLGAAALIYVLAGGRRAHPLIKVIVLTRYSVLMAIAQLAVALAGLGAFSSLTSLLQNVFILDNGWQLCHITWMSLLFGTAINVTARTTKLNAPFRFTDLREAIDGYVADAKLAAESTHPRKSVIGRLKSQLFLTFLHPQTPGPNYWRKRWIYLAAFSLPIPLTAMGLTFVDMQQTGSNPLGVLAALGTGLVEGVCIWVVVMLLTTLLQQLFLEQSALDAGLFPFDELPLVKKNWRLTHLDRIVGFLARSVSRLGPGYAVEDHATHRWRWLPGHGQLAIFAAVLASAYVFGLFFSELPRPHSWYSALFGLLVIMLSFGVLTTGAAFLLDFFRIPLVPTLLAVSFFTWWISGADSYYEVRKPAELQPLELEQVKFTNLQPPKKTLVVVTASGGGIQAAAWTAQVLTGLEEMYGKEFSDSIGVISSVSGGSVGTMFFLDRWDDIDSADAWPEIRSSAMESSLEATAWGWSGWDSVGTLAPFLVPPFRDRGWAVQESWQRSLTHPKDSLANWVAKARDGRFPIVDFNSTAADNGKRVVISNAALPQPKDPLKQGREAVKAIEYFKSSEGFDIPIATAARLSATFPYVSPISRPSAGQRALPPCRRRICR